MKQRRLRDWVIYSPLLAASVVLLFLCLTDPPPAISKATYDRIQMGMTERAVWDVVGTRPGGYDLFLAPGELVSQLRGASTHGNEWGNRDGLLSVGYDADGRVCAKGLEYHPSATPSTYPVGWWGRLRSRSVPLRYTYAVHFGGF